MIEPLFTVVRGTAGPEELAALAAVLLARAATDRAAAGGRDHARRGQLRRQIDPVFVPPLAWTHAAGV